MEHHTLTILKELFYLSESKREIICQFRVQKGHAEARCWDLNQYTHAGRGLVHNATMLTPKTMLPSEEKVACFSHCNKISISNIMMPRYKSFFITTDLMLL